MVIDFIALTGGPTGIDNLLAIQTGVLDDRGESPLDLDLHVESVIQFLQVGRPSAELTLDRGSSFAFDELPQPGHWLVRPSAPIPEPTTASILQPLRP